MGPTRLFGTIALVTIALVTVALAAALVLPTGAPGGSTSTSTQTTTSISTTSTVTSSSVSTTSTIATSTSTMVTSTSTVATSTSTTSTSSTSHQTTTSVGSKDGLQLILSIDTNSAFEGGSILVNVSEFNTLDVSNNVTRSGAWQVQGALSSCPNTNFQPFGVAVYQGHYASQNVSQGAQLSIFPITACPMFERLITGYLFQPDSDLAAVLPGSGSTPMTAGVEVNGTYAGLGESTPLNPGTYTVVAADEWGATAFLYLQVPRAFPRARPLVRHLGAGAGSARTASSS